MFGGKRKPQDDCRLHVRSGSVHEEGVRIDFVDCRGGLGEASSRAQCALEEIRAPRRAGHLFLSFGLKISSSA